jgi:hypothetical protein
MSGFGRGLFRPALQAATMLLAATSSIVAQDGGTILFKVITVKDEIVIGLSAAELDQLGGRDAGGLPARSLPRARCRSGNMR